MVPSEKIPLGSKAPLIVTISSGGRSVRSLSCSAVVSGDCCSSACGGVDGVCCGRGGTVTVQAARAKTSGRSRCKDRHRCINRKSLYTLCVPRISLLGVSLDAITMDEAVSRLLVLLHDDHQHHVVTPNSEMLVAASRDLAFLSVLQSAALALPDSAGLLWMGRWTDQ